jgi:hypothetical protein
MSRSRSRAKVATHPRPFLLFYGEHPGKQVTEENYHLRTRCSTMTGALCAGIRRLHHRGDATRVDIYDIAGIYHGYVAFHEGDGYKIKLTTLGWARKWDERKAHGVNFYF